MTALANELDDPPIIADIAALLRLRLNGLLPSEQADALARAQARDLALTYAGCQIYIPKRDGLALARRNAALCRSFNGTNHAALAQRYNLSVSHVYEILARQRPAKKNIFEGKQPQKSVNAV